MTNILLVSSVLYILLKLFKSWFFV